VRIAHFIGTLKKEDGVAKVVLMLVAEARKAGHETVIVTGWAEDPTVSPVPLITIPSVTFPLYREYRMPLFGYRAFKKELDAFNPDVLHVHSPDGSAWAARKYAKQTGIPAVITHHTDFPKYLQYYHISFLKPLVWWYLRLLYNRMSAVTTPSSVTAEDLARHGIRSPIAQTWGIDFSVFDPKRKSAEWRKKVAGAGNIVLCVCRLTWEKDLRTLAAAYMKLRAERDDFVMVVAGDGPARAELEKLMPGAMFLGRLDWKMLAEVYASSDIFLSPSTTETFGNVVIEAMASGCVPVAANEGGPKDIVLEGKTGFLTKPRDAEDSYEKTKLLLDNSKKRAAMRTAGLKHAQTFTWSNVFSSLLVLYQRLR